MQSVLVPSSAPAALESLPKSAKFVNPSPTPSSKSFTAIFFLGISSVFNLFNFADTYITPDAIRQIRTPNRQTATFFPMLNLRNQFPRFRLRRLLRAVLVLLGFPASFFAIYLPLFSYVYIYVKHYTLY